MKIALSGLRVGQVIFSVIVLALAVVLIKDQAADDTVPSALAFAAFAGGFGLLTGLICAAAIYVEAIPPLASMVLDALATIFFLAGGIVIAVKLRDVSCSDDSEQNWYDMSKNELLNGGCAKFQGKEVCGYANDPDHMRSRCKQNQADAAFQLINVVVLLTAITLTFLVMRRK